MPLYDKFIKFSAFENAFRGVRNSWDADANNFCCKLFLILTFSRRLTSVVSMKTCINECLLFSHITLIVLTLKLVLSGSSFEWSEMLSISLKFISTICSTMLGSSICDSCCSWALKNASREMCNYNTLQHIQILW